MSRGGLRQACGIVYGTYTADFPPVLVISSTRDLLFSSAVRLHRKLIASDVEAELHVFETLWHDFLITPVPSPSRVEDKGIMGQGS